MNPYASAKQAYTESAVLTASPEQLVVMLYDGAIRFCFQAAAALRSGERELARARLQRVEAIVDELNVSLDMEQGELPERLRSIYLFCKRSLVDAAIRQDPSPVDSVANLLGELREAWAGVVRTPELLSA
jgi:flagellar protein FliS